MKNLIVLMCFIILDLSLPGCKPKKTEAVAVPEAVIKGFDARYPGVSDVKWEQENDNGKVLYDGEFKMNDKKIEARFNDTGSFIDEK